MATTFVDYTGDGNATKAFSFPSIQESDIKAGKRAEFNARDYYHNIMIDRIFRQARRRAWARVTTQAEAIALIEEQREKVKQQRQKKIQTRNILNIPK